MPHCPRLAGLTSQLPFDRIIVKILYKVFPIQFVLVVPMRAIGCLFLAHALSTEHVSSVEVLKVVVAHDLSPRTWAFFFSHFLGRPLWEDLTLPMANIPCSSMPFTHFYVA